jgi:hypothetical protein
MEIQLAQIGSCIVLTQSNKLSLGLNFSRSCGRQVGLTTDHKVEETVSMCEQSGHPLCLCINCSLTQHLLYISCKSDQLN